MICSWCAFFPTYYLFLCANEWKGKIQIEKKREKEKKG